MDLDSILEECEAIQAIYCSENEATTLVQGKLLLVKKIPSLLLFHLLLI